MNSCLAFLKNKLHSATPRAITHPSKKRGSCNYFPNCTRIHAITITKNIKINANYSLLKYMYENSKHHFSFHYNYTGDHNDFKLKHI